MNWHTSPGLERRNLMTHEIRQRIRRLATQTEKDRHQQIRREIEEELPELARWAVTAAARHEDRTAVEERKE